MAVPFNIPTNSVGGKHVWLSHLGVGEATRISWVEAKDATGYLQCIAQPPPQSVILPRSQHAWLRTNPQHPSFSSIIYIIYFPFLLVFYWDKIPGKWECSAKGYVMLIGSFRRPGMGVGDGKKVSGDWWWKDSQERACVPPVGRRWHPQTHSSPRWSQHLLGRWKCTFSGLTSYSPNQKPQE